MFAFAIIVTGLLLGLSIAQAGAGATTGKKGKGKKGALLGRINDLMTKADANEKRLAEIAKTPDYGPGRSPGNLFGKGGGPPNVTRQNGERGYSVLKLAQLAKGLIQPAQAVEEVQISQKLQQAYGHAQFSSALYAGQSWLIPLHTGYLPRENDAQEKLAVEVRQKMAVQQASDPDQLAWLASKGVLNTKALGTIAGTAGIEFVQPGQIIELLEMQYNMEAFSQAGATQIPMMPNGRAYISRVASGATAGYVGEASAMTASQLTAGQSELIAKKIYVLTNINNELLRFGMPATEAMIKADMATQAALFVDRELFTGTGGTHLTGLMNETAYQQAAPPWVQGTEKILQYQSAPTAPKGIGANGNTLRPEDLDRMFSILPDRIKRPEVSLMLTKGLYGYVVSQRGDAITAGDQSGTFVLQRWNNQGNSSQMEETINGFKTVWSNNIPQNRVKSGGTTLTAAILGRFSDVVIARMGVGEIVANSWSDTYWLNDQSGLRLIQQVDSVLRYLASFAIYDYLING